MRNFPCSAAAASLKKNIAGPLLAWLVLGLLASSAVSRAQTFGSVSSLHYFTGGDGGNPVAGLIPGPGGNFYGTTSGIDTPAGYGTVFAVTPAGILTTLYSFTGGTDGGNPNGNLILGSDGNFYGTTSGENTTGYGTIFQITPAGVLTTLYTFTGGTDGGNPDAGLIEGPAGNFYGTTSGDNTTGYGTIFEITPAGALTTLYTFTGGTDGGNPEGNLVPGPNGNFYGTTSGNYTPTGYGTIFEITPAGALTTLYSFTGGTDGGNLQASLTLGVNGNFYGTSGGENTSGYGTVFEVTPAGVLTTLYSFTGGIDGDAPDASLILGSNGNFYGTTSGDISGNYGTVFALTPAGVLSTLYGFSGLSDGGEPEGSLIQAGDGSFYGTTFTTDGGGGYGTVFQLKLGPPPTFFDGEVPLSNGVDYLAFPNGNFFGYYSFLNDPVYLYHFDLGYEYVIDANDGKSGIYLYDFMSNDFFYTSPTFPFPYLYDFNLGSILYYFPDPNSPGHYNTNGVRYFYEFNTGTVITK